MNSKLEEMVCDYIDHYVTRSKMFTEMGDMELARFCKEQAELMAVLAMHPLYSFFWSGDLSVYLKNDSDNSNLQDT